MNQKKNSNYRCLCASLCLCLLVDVSLHQRMTWLRCVCADRLTRHAPPDPLPLVVWFVARADEDAYIYSENTEIILSLSLTELKPKPKAGPVNHTVPVAVTHRALSSLAPTQCSPFCAHIRPRASPLYAAAHALPDFTCRPPCRLQHDLDKTV